MGDAGGDGAGGLQTPREQWGTRSGFVLATIGSAVGLGNIWRFSYVAGVNGGGAFLVVYLLCVLLIGLPLLVAEIALGRRARCDAVAAFRLLATGRFWPLVGGLGVLTAIVELGFYSLIAGWALRYFAVTAIDGPVPAGADFVGGFAAFVASPMEPFVWQILMLTATVLVVARGIRGGIELLNRTLMPLLAAIVVALAAFAVTLDGAADGLRFLFAPDWSALARPQVYLAAVGQAFFSIGVGMTIFVTYGSYLTPDQNVPRAAILTVVGDTAFALTAGVAIFAAVFAFGFDPQAGPTLAFVTLPQLFAAMPGGRVVAPVFFLLLSAAALTSMVSILEVAVAYLVRRVGWSRRAAVPVLGLFVFAVGFPAGLGFGVLAGVRIGEHDLFGAYDYLVANVSLPLGGLLLALFAGWVWSRRDALPSADFGDGAFGRLWLGLLRIPIPLAIAAVMLAGWGLL